MTNLKLTKEEFRLVRMAVAGQLEKLALQDGKALASLIAKFIEELKKNKHSS